MDQQEIQDSLWPAETSRTRPLMPLRRGHLAMLVAAGFLDNLVLEADGQRVLVKGRTTKEMVLVEETEETEVYRERLKTTVVALTWSTAPSATSRRRPSPTTRGETFRPRRFP